MDSIVLSNRLKTIASFVPKGKKIADIGSDHALLPSYLVYNHIVPFAIAGEVNDGPLQAAKRQVQLYQLEDQISVRKGNGLEVIHPKEVDVITIAGMGGALIGQILEDGKEKLSSIERLILQPNVGEELVRKWLDKNQWFIVNETILEENEKIYEIIIAEPKNNQRQNPYQGLDITKEELYRLGPILWQKRSPILLKKWQRELQKVDYVIKQLERAMNENEKTKKIEELMVERNWILGVLECLQKDKPLFN
ncbi:tRNA (adenine(22)-N(1))-methyltransferase [Tepidibacillus fermentans]|uniref:tRNA (Adenine22-N1)-methyltransferase n=1 Tax=Tepidibacillus fermentans TaxID=1281767 RepID=A0A4R3KLI8_9BACI|nr:tRNA (adenine(22)-N(1))-methyltransferase TrmK [Tepidibacillus fermentans]TCS83713.1 tRNA (adenine22-N1)-methyltransferase [Tepidibacillus fermentans]